MQRAGSGIRVLIGLWILAGLAVAGINGYLLMALLDEPLAGYSDMARQAERGFRQYHTLLAAKAENITSGMDLLAKRFAPAAVVVEQPAEVRAAIPAPVRKPVQSQPVALPTLAGIVTSRSTDGVYSRLALLDGRLFSEGDTLGELTVKKISDHGVLLARAGRTWFLKTPEITCSLTTR